MKRLSEYFPASEPKRVATGHDTVTPSQSPDTARSSAPSSISPTISAPATSSLLLPGSEKPSVADPMDIGRAADKSNLTDQERFRLLQTKWVAPPGFQWPSTERMDKGKIRRKYLGKHHFEGLYDCFAFSLSKNGVFCKPCALFAQSEVRGVELNRLVKTPLQKYAHLTGNGCTLTSHLQTKFHEDAVTRANAFIATVHGEAPSVDVQLNVANAKSREKNRAVLRRIIRAIELHGRLGLPLRGHRDSGELPLPPPSDETSSPEGTKATFDQGNFRAILQLMVESNDKVLEEHFRTTGKNATYISPLAQNSLIDAVAAVVQRHIVDELKEARFFSLLADETTDFSHQEQVTVCLHYVSADLVIRERFLCFAIAPDLTGRGLSDQLLGILANNEIDINCMVGQGYDGAAAMSGSSNGVQSFILNRCPSAAYVHCASHSLNLALLKAAQDPQIRAAVTLMHELAVFFTESNKRLMDLQACIELECPESIEMPRIVSKQRHRSNVPADSPEDYYRPSVFLPFVDVDVNHGGNETQRIEPSLYQQGHSPRLRTGYR